MSENDKINVVGTNIAEKAQIRIKVPNPPYDEQVEIAEYLDKKISEIDKLISEKEELIKELESYKKSLIYEYVTGKKEVPAENVR